jgi:hypothetical protein
VPGYIGVYGDCTGFRFEKPRPGNLYGAWAADDLGGFWGGVVERIDQWRESLVEAV